LHNVLKGTVAAIHRPAHEDHVTVQVIVGGVRLLADVTPDAVERLQLGVGTAVHALIKAVSVDVLGQHAHAAVGSSPTSS
jgi:molybdopterin-binding protein